RGPPRPGQDDDPRRRIRQGPRALRTGRRDVPAAAHVSQPRGLLELRRAVRQGLQLRPEGDRARSGGHLQPDLRRHLPDPARAPGRSRAHRPRERIAAARLVQSRRDLGTARPRRKSAGAARPSLLPLRAGSGGAAEGDGRGAGRCGVRLVAAKSQIRRADRQRRPRHRHALVSTFTRGLRNRTAEMQELLRYRDLIRVLVERDLKVRYRRSAFGFLWTMLQPLLTMLVFTMVFASVFRFDRPNYWIYALAGVLFWNFFSQSIISSMNSLRGNAQLLQKLPVPKIVFPLATVISGVINLALALIPLFAILLLTGHRPGWAILFLPVAILLAALFTLGAGLLLSPLAVFF